MKRLVLPAFLVALFAVTRLAAQAEPKQDSADLAKQLANPVASLVSVPFQTNWNFGVGPGPDNDTQFLLNFHPVMPFAMNKEWNLIARVIVPYLSQPPLTPGGATASGVGDILVSGFFSPRSRRSSLYLQPFGSYTTAKATTYTLSSETTANWNQPGSNTWTVPILAQVSQLFRLGRRPVSIGAGYGHYVESPDGGPNWKFRAILTLLFPK